MPPDAAARPAHRPSRAVTVAAACVALLLAAAVAPYLGVGGHGFVFDDLGYVTKPPEVQRGLGAASARWAFTTFWMGNWHPLTWLSHLADVSLFGVAPGPMHLVNVGLHAAATLLLALLLARLGLGRGVAVAAAALFAAHPVHVESVAWVSERKDLLAAVFFLLAILAHERRARRPGAGRAAAVAACLALGLMAKAMVVTLPFVLLLLDWWPLGRMAAPGRAARPDPRLLGRLLLEKAPLFALAAAGSVIAVVAQRAMNALGSLEHFDPGRRAANALLGYAGYLASALWPAGLSPFYPYPDRIPPAWQLAAAALLLAVLSALGLALARRFPAGAVGWLWFLGMLVPVIGLVQVGSQARADRYLYLPIAGVLVAGVVAAGRLLGRSRTARIGGAVLALAATAALGAAANRQVGHWRDEVSLFARAVEFAPGSWLAQGNYGHALYQARRYADAVPHLREAIRLYPTYYEANLNLGLALSALGRVEEALVALARATEVNPLASESYINRAMLYVQLGRKEEALAMYRALARFDPPDAVRLLPFIRTLR